MLAALGGPALAAIRLEIGILGGTRTVNSADIKAVYGNGTVLYPYLALHPWKGLFVGAGYEGGYSRKGMIGIYEERTTLRVVGVEAFAGYQIQAGNVSPYIKIGYARYSYRQTIESPHIGDQAADASKWGPTFGGGLKIADLRSPLPGRGDQVRPAHGQTLRGRGRPGGNAIHGRLRTEILDIRY